MTDVRTETVRAQTLTLEVDGWSGHLAGQHIDVRLTAEDGYQAVRSYSLSSGAGEAPQITAVRLEDGEVSSYLVDVAAEGDTLEVRGPVGGWFVWTPALGPERPVQLVAGGSGVAPMRAMLRTRAADGRRTRMRLLYSARTADDVLFRTELGDDPDVHITLTQGVPPAWPGSKGRIDAALLDEVAWPADLGPRVYVCGATSFVEAMADVLVERGHDPADVLSERFGA